MRTNTIHTIAVMAVATILFGLVHVNGQTQQQQQQQSQPQSQPQLRHTTNTVGLRDLQYSIAEDADLAATASALYVNETEGNNFDVNETEGNNFDADADVDFDNDEEDNDEIDRSTDKPWGGLIGAALLINVTTLAGVVVVAGHWLRTIICPDTKVKESSRLLLVEVLIPMFACGALLATTFFILFPESYNIVSGEFGGGGHGNHGREDRRILEEHGNEHSEGAATWRWGSAIMGGFWIPLFLHACFPHDHDHNHGSNSKGIRDNTGTSNSNSNSNSNGTNNTNNTSSASSAIENGAVDNDTTDNTTNTNNHDNQHQHRSGIQNLKATMVCAFLGLEWKEFPDHGVIAAGAVSELLGNTFERVGKKATYTDSDFSLRTAVSAYAALAKAAARADAQNEVDNMNSTSSSTNNNNNNSTNNTNTNFSSCVHTKVMALPTSVCLLFKIINAIALEDNNSHNNNHNKSGSGGGSNDSSSSSHYARDSTYHWDIRAGDLAVGAIMSLLPALLEGTGCERPSSMGTQQACADLSKMFVFFSKKTNSIAARARSLEVAEKLTESASGSALPLLEASYDSCRNFGIHRLQKNFL